MTKCNEAAQRITSFLDLKLNIQAVGLIEDPSGVPANAETQFDFPRPPFYNELFATWGLEQGGEWRGHGRG